MNKIVTMLLAIMLCLPSCARADGITISRDRLPKESKTLLDTYFADKTCVLVKKDNNEYEVVFKGGEKVEFDSRGRWTEIDCLTSAVPADLVPEQIRAYVLDNYPDNRIVRIERQNRGYEIRLDNRIELDFNRNFVLTDFDIDD